MQNQSWKEIVVLARETFPKGSPLHPLINRKKVKLSYRCLPNMRAKLSQQNKQILRDPPAQKAPEHRAGKVGENL